MSDERMTAAERLAARLGIPSPMESRRQLTRRLAEPYGGEAAARRRKIAAIDEELRVIARRARTEGRLLTLADSERLTDLAIQRLELAEEGGVAQ